RGALFYHAEKLFYAVGCRGKLQPLLLVVFIRVHPVYLVRAGYVIRISFVPENPVFVDGFGEFTRNGDRIIPAPDTFRISVQDIYFASNSNTVVLLGGKFVLVFMADFVAELALLGTQLFKFLRRHQLVGTAIKYPFFIIGVGNFEQFTRKLL